MTKLEKLLQPHTVRFWGSDREVRPVLVDDIRGDGQCLMTLQPLNTRPHYYVIRVDSGLEAMNHEDQVDEIDCILEAIVEQFGEAGEDDGWPMLSDSSGWTWGVVE